MPSSEEGNRRSGVALAMRHRLHWLIQLWAHGLDREMSTPPVLSCGVCPFYLTFTTLSFFPLTNVLLLPDHSNSVFRRMIC